MKLQACTKCGAQFDITPYQPGEQFTCGSCGEVFAWSRIAMHTFMSLDTPTVKSWLKCISMCGRRFPSPFMESAVTWKRMPNWRTNAKSNTRS